MRRMLLALLAGVSLWSIQATAVSAVTQKSEPDPSAAIEQLRSFIRDVSTATGKFSQYTVGPQGQTKPRQTGDFSFKRPGQFKWDVLLPYQQLVVSDGKFLFQFDPDLNQVMVRSVNQAIGSSPAAILFGSGNIEQVFDLQALPGESGLAWLRAKPKSTEAGFVQVDMGFSDGLPVQIRLLDSFGQTTKLELSGLVRNPPLEQREFQFVPPAGVDIVKSQ